MENYNESFQPDAVDEQIEQPLSLPSEDAHLVDALQQIYRPYAHRNGQSLDRAWQRIQQHRMHHALFSQNVRSQSDGKSYNRLQQKRNTPMRTTSSRPGRLRSFSRQLNSVAAIVFVALLVGSMALIFGLASLRGHKTTTAGPGGNTVQSPTVISTATPIPPGKTIFTYTPDLQQQLGMMSLGWSSDGKHIAVSGLDIVLLDAQNGKELAHFGNSNASLWVNWSPDGQRLVTSSNTAQIWDIKTQQSLVTYQPNSAIGSISSSANPEMRLSGGNMIYASAWSHDSKLIASAIDGNAYGYNVQVWDASTGSNIRTLQINPNASAGDYIDDVAWSSDGKYLAASSPHDGVFIWDTSTWQVVQSWPGGSKLAWSPTGDLIATIASDGNSIGVRDASTGQVQYSFQGQASGQSVSSLAWSPNGRYIATGGHDVRIWDTNARTLFYTYTGHGNSPNLFIRSLAWSSDSTRVASLGTGMNITAPHVGQPIGAVKVWIAA